MDSREFLTTFQGAANVLHEAAEKFAAATDRQLLLARTNALAVDRSALDMTDALQSDLTLLDAAPIAAVPRFSPFDPMRHNGHRFLVAVDGMYLEVRRPWLHFIHRIAAHSDLAMLLVARGRVNLPFGTVEPRTELAFGRLGNAIDHIRGFVADARREAPKEWADMLVWNEIAQELSRLNVEILSSSCGAVQYRCRPLDDYESIAIDLHSHGELPAFFSETDDQDDAGSVKISGVIGGLNTETPTVAFRLCVLGLYLPIAVPAKAIFGDQ